MTATAALDVMTAGDIRRETGCDLWQARAVLDSLGIAKRIGGYRIIDSRDLPFVVEELDRRGYLMSTVVGGGDAGPSVSSGVADSPTRSAPGANRGASVNPHGATLSKGGDDDRPESRAEADRAFNDTPE